MKLHNLIQYIEQKITQLGGQLVYAALLLYYAYLREDTSPWAKRIIIGAFAYLLNPIDAIPDLSPFIGYTDDFGILSFALVNVACYINQEVRENARLRAHKMGLRLDEVAFQKIDDHL